MPHEAHAPWKLAIEMWNTASAELAAQAYTLHAQYHEPGREPLHGPREFAARAAEIHAGFPDFHTEVTRTLVEGNQFVLCWTCRGTHKGAFNGIPATGKLVEFRGVSVGRISQGRIHEECVYYDRLSILEQLGAVPTPARAELAAAR